MPEILSRPVRFLEYGALGDFMANIIHGNCKGFRALYFGLCTFHKLTPTVGNEKIECRDDSSGFCKNYH